jgi:hypothetical protein
MCESVRLDSLEGALSVSEVTNVDAAKPADAVRRPPLACGPVGGPQPRGWLRRSFRFGSLCKMAPGCDELLWFVQSVAAAMNCCGGLCKVAAAMRCCCGGLCKGPR